MTSASPASFCRRVARGIVPFAAVFVWLGLASVPAWAQDSKLADGPPPPPAEETAPRPTSQPDATAPPAAKPAPVDPASSGPARPEDPDEATKPAAPEEPAQPVIDPVGAARSLDVGTFYFKKGDYDAAIDRFQESAQRQPKSAKPYLLMGEAYEKKGDPASAITAYHKYLQLYRNAPDQEKVNKRIEKLTQEESKRDPLRH